MENQQEQVNQQQQTSQPEEQSQPQEKQENKTPLGVDIDTINSLLQEKYSQMNFMYTDPNLSKPIKQEKQEKQDTEETDNDTEPYVPFNVENLIDDDITPVKLKKALKTVYSKAVEDVYKTIPIAIAKIASEMFTPMYLAQQFFDKYPKLEKYSPIIAHMITKIKEKEPAKTPREVMSIVENEIKSMIELIENNNNKENQIKTPSINTGDKNTKKENREEGYIDMLLRNNNNSEELNKLKDLGW